MKGKVDGGGLAGLAVLFLLVGSLLSGGLETEIAEAAPAPELATLSLPPANPEDLIAPYTSYTVTQGPHGQAYGHLAIDLGAGHGAPILSPISGSVVDRYIDPYGNPVLVIENEVYVVTLMHGEYSVGVGQSVNIGQEVGKESNLGYTTDMNGNPCNERAGCGYHTHWNVYDKRIAANVNPLDLLEEQDR
ncbi:MAG: peptidoglycan DD-metalloendopeptidase family protein [Anaerolineales bacterium]|nr:peptidoglycan DD-metalloendopeptidase family protein [Anaerolineales bacterium]